MVVLNNQIFLAVIVSAGSEKHLPFFSIEVGRVSKIVHKVKKVKSALGNVGGEGTS